MGVIVRLRKSAISSSMLAGGRLRPAPGVPLELAAALDAAAWELWPSYFLRVSARLTSTRCVWADCHSGLWYCCHIAPDEGGCSLRERGHLSWKLHGKWEMVGRDGGGGDAVGRGGCAVGGACCEDWCGVASIHQSQQHPQCPHIAET